MLHIDKNRKVHEQITEETWCKGGTTYDKQCMVLWIVSVYGNDAIRFAHYERIKTELGYLVDNECYRLKDIYNWNDAPERTFDDILALLRKLDI